MMTTKKTATFCAAAKAWKGWAATLVSDTDGEGNVTYSVKYGKRGTVVVIQ
jgi:hypothetical protein